MPNEQLIQDLKATRSNIEKGWIKGAFAQKLDGEACESINPEACCFCLAGAAINATRDELLSEKRWYALGKALESVIGGSIITFNDGDGRTLEEILAVIDQAIEEATKV
jgi:hypothetical protein